MFALDALVALDPRDVPLLESPRAEQLARGELYAMITDWPCVAHEVPVVENLGTRQVGRAVLCRLAGLPGVYVRIKFTDERLVRELREQASNPGTVTEIMRDGVVVGLSINTGGYHKALAETWN